VKIAFVSNPNKLSGKLCKFWTGSYTYHVALVDLERGFMYDMHKLLRRRVWPYYGPETTVTLVDTPVKITSKYMEHLLSTDESTYGFIDYVLFAIRPIYHVFGKSTRNANGVICSEMVYNVLKANGWTHEFKEVPSPADLEKVLL
jgi:hypothetical protein